MGVRCKVGLKSESNCVGPFCSKVKSSYLHHALVPSRLLYLNFGVEKSAYNARGDCLLHKHPPYLLHRLPVIVVGVVIGIAGLGVSYTDI